jgi:protein-S-isoprenylcysteine O-methyltransferase Ste14
MLVFFLSFILVLSGVFINLKHRASKQLSSKDHSLLWFRIAVPMALISSLFFYYSKQGAIEIPASIQGLGLLLYIFGLCLRWMAVYTLGQLFTVDLNIAKQHQLQSSGVFKHIRHPSYSGLLLYYIGLGVVQANWLSLLVLICLPLSAVLYRIPLEEKMLNNRFGEAYKTYQKNTYKLLPYVY